MVQQPLPFIDYSARDFEAIKGSLTEYLRQRFPDDFTDFTESQLGIAILEQIAYSYSILSFMLDRQVNELFLDPARERQSVINLAALLNYKLSTGTAASVDVLLDTSVLTAYSDPVTVSTGASVGVGELTFEATQDYVIQRSGTSPNFQWTVNGVNQQTTPTISLSEGVTVTDTFTSDGTKFLELLLSRESLISGSLSTVVANVTWLLVDSLVIGNPDDPDDVQIYETKTDEDDRPTLIFGDGTAGQIPAEGSAIVATYRVGGGSQGNVAADAVRQSVQATVGGQSISIPITNPNPAVGGTDRESLDHAKLFAPQFARTMDRAVSYSDYFALSNGYTDGTNGVVAKAGVIAGPTDGISNVVTMYVWGEDAAGNLIPVSQSLKDSLYNFLNNRRVLSVWLSPIQDGITTSVDVTALIRVDPAFTESEVIFTATTAVRNLFQETRVRFGNEVRLSWVYDTLQTVAGLSWVHITTFGAIDGPEVIQGTVQELEPKQNLPVQSGSASGALNRVTLDTPGSRIADYYCNYRLTIDLGTAIETRRIIGSTVSIANRVDVTVDQDYTQDPSGSILPGIGDEATLSHPRRIKLDTNVEQIDGLYDNLVLVHTSGGPGTIAQERSIVEYQPNSEPLLALVDKDWVTTPAAPDAYTLAPDYRVIDSNAIVAGTIDITSVI